MSTIIKYIIFIISFTALVLSYLIYTPLGNQQIYNSISYMLTKKAGLDVDVESINIKQYPYLEADMIVEDKYNLKLKGFLENNYLDMNYTLTSNCLQSAICTIDDEINIQGHISGPVGNVHVTGEGTALDGNVSYSLLKQSDIFKDINFVINDMNSSKLFTLLGQNAIFKGKSNAHILFDHIGEKSKKGKIVYDIKDKNFSGLLVDLHTQIDIDNTNHTFIMDITAPELTLHLTKGRYDQEKN
ncbi:hypothetical protein ACFLR6_03030, partial [Campylobacterota bacterium]